MIQKAVHLNKFISAKKWVHELNKLIDDKKTVMN